MLTTSASPVEGGTVFPGTRQYESGDTANLVAAPAAEYVFESWTGATGTEETTLVMDADKTVVANFISTEIEWIALNSAYVDKDKQETVIEFLDSLEDDDDVQNVFSNANFENN